MRSWLSFELVTYVWQIILQDFLGYSVELMAPSLQASHWVEYMQSGEVDMELENWQIDTGHPMYKKFVLDEQLADADGIGYNGRSGLFVNTRLLDSEPLADSYRFWQNPSVFRSSDILLYPALNLSSWLGADFPVCRPPATLWCNELPGYWMSDLCRTQPEQCALVIHPTPTWDPGYFEQLITNHKLYALVAYVGGGTLASYVTQQVDKGQNVLFYWYDPDPLITRTQAYRISFPDYAFGCLEKHARNPSGELTCDYPETTLRKLIRRALRQEAPEAYYSFSKFHMLREDIYSALGSTVQGGGTYTNAFDAACAYVKANEAKILADVAPPCVSSPLANPQTGDLVFDPSFLECTAFVAYPELPQPATCLSTSKGTANRGGDVIKLAVRGWLSHRLSTAVVEILLREYLRYDVRLVNASSSDPAGWGPDMAANAFGVDVENDMAAAGSPERIKWVTEQNLVSAPLPVGYSRRSAVYVLPHSVVKSPYVDFFRFYGTQRQNTSFYTFADIDLGSLVGAEFPVCDNAVHSWCGTGAFEGWYVPPACQGSPGDCAVVFAATPDQDTGYFEQLTRNLGLSLVHAYLGVEGLKHFVRQAHVSATKDILFHWYEPEPFTTAVGAIRVSFPDHAHGCTWGNTLDPRNGTVACDSGPVQLNKLTRSTLTQKLPEAAYLLSRFTLTTEEMQTLMGQHQDTGGSLDTYESACRFVRSSAAKLERDVVPDCISKPKQLADIRVGDMLFKPGEGVCVEVTCEATNILLVVGETVICEACPGDRVPDANQTQCVTCPMGSSPELKAGKLECACNAGRRQISSDGGPTECELCPAGKFANLPKGATSCEDCTPGKHSDTDGQTQCLNCTAGRSSNQLRRTSCAVCPRGSYQEAEGQTACSECGANMVTQFREAASADQCVCQEAFYRADPASPCMSCPAAMICPLGSEMSNFDSWKAGGPHEAFPEAHAGYMSLSQLPVSVYHCDTVEKCPGGPPGTCGPGLDTNSPSCTHCRDGSYWDGDSCAACHSQSWLFAVIPWLIGPPIILVMYNLSRDEVEKWGSWRNCATCMTFLVLNHYQISSLLARANVRILSGVADLFKIYEASEDPLSIFNPSCAGYRTFLDNLALRASLPGILLAMVLLTYVASHAWAFLVWGGREKALDRNRTVNVYFSFIFTFFVGICSVVLSTFKCTKNPNGKPTLLVDRSIHCYESEWIGGAAISGLAALYLIAFGGLFFWAVWEAPGRFADQGFRRRWKFLFIKFRPDVWYWALLFCGKSLLLNAGFIFIQEGTFQAYWLMAVLLTYVSLVVSFFPWRHTAANVLDVYRCFALILVIALLISAANTVFDGLVGAATRAVLTVSLSIPAVTLLLFAWAVHRQVSPLARHSFESKMRKLFESMKEFSNATDDDMVRFVWQLDETARWHILSTMHILGAELSGMAHPKRRRLIVEAASSWYSCNSKENVSTRGHLSSYVTTGYLSYCHV